MHIMLGCKWQGFKNMVNQIMRQLIGLREIAHVWIFNIYINIHE